MHRMILPPMVMYASRLGRAKEALLAYIGTDCILSTNIDEQCVFFTFKDTLETHLLKTMIGELAYGIEFEYEGTRYKLHTQYFDI